MAIDEKQIQQVEPRLRRYDLLTVSQLRELSHFHSDRHPVVSLYLNVPLSEKKRDELRSKLDHFIDERQRVLHTESKYRWHEFLEEAERLKDWLETEYDGTGHGLAIFASGQNRLWRVFRLPQSVRDQLIISDRPYLRPLLTLADEYERYLVLLVNKETARLFAVYMGEIEEYRELQDELVPHPKVGPGEAVDKFQRHHEMHVLWHVKHAVEVLERLWKREQADWLIIGGTDDPLAQLREHLPKALWERLAGQVSVAVDALPDQVLKAVLPIEQANEQRIEAESTDALITAALAKGPGVLGLDDTLEAIVGGRVMTLVVEEDFSRPGFECPNDHFLIANQLEECPLCGTKLDPQVDIVERAMEQALDQDAKIEVVRGEMRNKLAEHGHIGALLRYGRSDVTSKSGT